MKIINCLACDCSELTMSIPIDDNFLTVRDVIIYMIRFQYEMEEFPTNVNEYIERVNRQDPDISMCFHSVNEDTYVTKYDVRFYIWTCNNTNWSFNNKEEMVSDSVVRDKKIDYFYYIDYDMICRNITNKQRDNIDKHVLPIHDNAKHYPNHHYPKWMQLENKKIICLICHLND